MHLHELGVRVDGAVHVGAAVGAAGIDGAVGAAAVDDSGTSGRQTNRVGGKCLDLHRPQVERGDPPAGALLVLDEREVFPVLVLAHQAVVLVPAHLLVECVEELLARRGAGERGAVVQRAAEAAEVEQPLAGAVEGHAHPVQQIDDLRSGVAHPLHRRLLGEEIAALQRVLDVDVGVVPFPFGVHRAVDATLGADRMASFDGHDREDIDVLAGLGELDDGHEPRQPAADDDVALRHSPHASCAATT